MNFKLGGTLAEELPWEFRHQMRPWFGPYLAVGFYKVFSLLGGLSPFVFSFLLRLGHALFAFLSLWFFLQRSREWFRSEYGFNLALLLSQFLWFIPYIHVRSSSENLGLSFYLLGSSLFFKKEKTLFSGLFWGLSYLARSQMALMVAPLWFYRLVKEKRLDATLIKSAIGVLIMIGAGVVIDSIGYQKLTFSTWNYFYQNFMGDVLTRMGTDSFFAYMKWSILKGIPPLGLVALICYGLFVIRFLKHPLTWMTLPIVIFHHLIGHKELRFLFPVIALTPLCMAKVMEIYPSLLLNKWWRHFNKVLFVQNGILLVVILFHPPNSAIDFYEFIWKHPEIKIINALEEDPFKMLGLPLNFYKRPGVSVEVHQNIKDLLNIGSEAIIFSKKGDHYLQLRENKNCRPIYLSYPQWALDFYFRRMEPRMRVRSLFYCKS